MSDLCSFQARAQGRVQGVYYRVFTAKSATRLGLTGYVRNLPDRSVEICAEGEREQLGKLVEQLRTGPPGARIDNLSLVWVEYTGKYHGFAVTR
jgi:acylphosphatase